MAGTYSDYFLDGVAETATLLGYEMRVPKHEPDEIVLHIVEPNGKVVALISLSQAGIVQHRTKIGERK